MSDELDFLEGRLDQESSVRQELALRGSLECLSSDVRNCLEQQKRHILGWHIPMLFDINVDYFLAYYFVQFLIFLSLLGR